MTTTRTTTTTASATDPNEPNTMSALVAAAGERRIERRRVPVPRPRPGEVLVAVHAFSINRGELALLAHREPGWRPGQDIAGEVVAVGQGVSRIEVGQRVAALVDGGGWAEYALASEARTAAVPDGVTLEQAAALPMAGTTALGLVQQGGALLGRRALVTGASGGVGGYAVQLLSRAGARVVALSRSGHAERLRGLGADEVVESLDSLNAPVDFALESVGGHTLADTVAHMSPGGTIMVFGNSSGEPTPLDVFAFAGGHEDARLQTYFSYRHEHTAGASLATLLDLASRGELRIDLGLQEPWEATEDALDALARRRVSAKAVLTVTTRTLLNSTLQ